MSIFVLKPFRVSATNSPFSITQGQIDRAQHWSKMPACLIIKMRGIIIAVPKKYQEITLRNLIGLRLHLNCHLPIEIWEIGKEVDSEFREKFTSLGNVRCLNVED